MFIFNYLPCACIPEVLFVDAQMASIHRRALSVFVLLGMPHYYTVDITSCSVKNSFEYWSPRNETVRHSFHHFIVDLHNT